MVTYYYETGGIEIMRGKGRGRHTIIDCHTREFVDRWKKLQSENPDVPDVQQAVIDDLIKETRCQITKAERKEIYNGFAEWYDEEGDNWSDYLELQVETKSFGDHFHLIVSFEDKEVILDGGDVDYVSAEIALNWFMEHIADEDKIRNYSYDDFYQNWLDDVWNDAWGGNDYSDKEQIEDKLQRKLTKEEENEIYRELDSCWSEHIGIYEDSEGFAEILEKVKKDILERRAKGEKVNKW